ncbi:MAG: DNA polymerase Y family protein, partial [Actinomycetota bacterium]|nr:DNA polymerase Y family protein [Actinomycetota bacterium]
VRTPPPDLAVAAELDPPADRVEAAAFVARGLAERLTQQLSDRGLTVTRIQVEAESEHGERLSRLWRHDGGLTPAALAERVRWQLDGWRTTGGLTLIRLAPDEVRPDDGRQLGFWGGDRAAAERAALALARVQGILGPDAVVTATLDGGRGPAERARLVPWGESRPVGGDGSWPGRVPPPAPSTVHLFSLPAEVVDGSGAAVGVTGRGAPTGRPARLSIAGGPWAEVTAWAGPWPYDERWWAGAARSAPADTGRLAARSRLARWQVTTTAGAAHLLAVEGGRWSVEATYD